MDGPSRCPINDQSYRIMTLINCLTRLHLDGCLMIALWLPDDCLMTTWGLPYDYLRTAWGLPEDCLMTARRLPDDCLRTTWGLPEDCLTTAWRLLDNCLTIAWQSFSLYFVGDDGNCHDFPTKGTIHLRRRLALGGEGLKICQICRRIVLKNCRR